MFSRSQAIKVLKNHGCSIRDFRDFIFMIGIKNEYSTKELKHFLGY
jgi:hypothetical protein